MLGSDSRIEDQRYTYSTAWSLTRGNLESQEVDSMIRYFVNHGGPLNQTVERSLESTLRRIENEHGLPI